MRASPVPSCFWPVKVRSVCGVPLLTANGRSTRMARADEPTIRAFLLSAVTPRPVLLLASEGCPEPVACTELVEVKGEIVYYRRSN